MPDSEAYAQDADLGLPGGLVVACGAGFRKLRKGHAHGTLHGRHCLRYLLQCDCQHFYRQPKVGL